MVECPPDTYVIAAGITKVFSGVQDISVRILIGNGAA